MLADNSLLDSSAFLYRKVVQPFLNFESLIVGQIDVAVLLHRLILISFTVYLRTECAWLVLFFVLDIAEVVRFLLSYLARANAVLIEFFA